MRVIWYRHKLCKKKPSAEGNVYSRRVHALYFFHSPLSKLAQMLFSAYIDLLLELFKHKYARNIFLSQSSIPSLKSQMRHPQILALYIIILHTVSLLPSSNAASTNNNPSGIENTVCILSIQSFQRSFVLLPVMVTAYSS